MTRLSLQREKKHERKAKASSSSSSYLGFSPFMPVPLCQLTLSAGTSMVATTLSSSVCVVTYSATAPVVSAATFVLSMDLTPVEPSHKRRLFNSPREKAKMLSHLRFPLRCWSLLRLRL